MAEEEIDLTQLPLDPMFLLQMYSKLKQVNDRGGIIEVEEPMVMDTNESFTKEGVSLPSSDSETSNFISFKFLKFKQIEALNERSRDACQLFCGLIASGVQCPVTQMSKDLDLKPKEALEMILDQVWNFRAKIPTPYEKFSLAPLMREYLVGRVELESLKQTLMDSDITNFGVREIMRHSTFLCPSVLEIILTILYAETQGSPLYDDAVSVLEELEVMIEDSTMETDEVMEIFDATYESLKDQIEGEHDDVLAELKQLSKSVDENSESFEALTHRLNDLSAKVNAAKTERIQRQLKEIEENVVEVMDDTEPIGEIVPTKYRRNMEDLIVVKEVTNDDMHYVRLPPLPPQSEWPALLIGDKCLIMPKDLLGQHPKWIEATVEEVVDAQGEPRFKVRYPIQRTTMATRWTEKKDMGYATVPEWRLDEGVRVVAFYKDESNRHFDGWYSGTVGEKPASYNRERYLVFFDDGAVQYVRNDLVRLICQQHSNPRSSFLDLPETSSIKDFLSEYLEGYPDRLMIRVRRTGEKIRAERQGKWYMKKGEMATVIAIDGSLIKVRFPTHPPSDEWLFRGSPRLWEIATSASSRSTARKSNATTPQRTRVSRNLTQRRRVEIVNQATVSASLQVAKKSTVPKQRSGRKFYEEEWSSESSSEASDSDENNLDSVMGGALMGRSYQVITRRTWNFEFVEVKLPAERKVPNNFLFHRKGPCCSLCIAGSLEQRAINEVRGKSPFVAPMLCGWDRQLAEFDDKDPKKKFVYYVAPCGRRLRNMAEVIMYIKLTESILPGDYFTFERAVQPLRIYKVLNAPYANPDYANGNENVPVSVVNSFSVEPPPAISYSADRYPWDGAAEIPKVCSGCRCEDDCSDPDKCACQQLTIESINCLNPDDRPPKGKQTYMKERRLASHGAAGVKSGIYECNDQCSCRRARCVNSVAQRKLMLPLQLFKTAEKGWGIRTLVDVPKGQFVCTYAGALLSDEAAERLGRENEGGDEYFADLDLIASLERDKEGYESDEEEDRLSEDVVGAEDLGEMKGKQEGEMIMNTDERFDEVETSPSPVEEGEDNHTARKRGSASGGAISPKNAMMPASAAPDEQDIVSDRFKLTVYYGNQYPFVIDAKRCGNLGRYLNHSCEPNVFVQNVMVDSHDLRFPWVAFFALRNIKAGEELCWDYSYELGPESQAVYCRCGTKKCRKRLR